MGPVTAPTVRAFLGDAAGFPTAKASAGYVGPHMLIHPETGYACQPASDCTRWPAAPSPSATKDWTGWAST